MILRKKIIYSPLKKSFRDAKRNAIIIQLSAITQRIMTKTLLSHSSITTSHKALCNKDQTDIAGQTLHQCC